MIGSDPHFAIRLSGGALLCYTFQGQSNTTFNLVSNDQFQMNALFVPDDTDYDNTWLGSIGIAVHHNGKKITTLQFTAADQLVRIGERIAFEAKTIKKLSFHNSKLTMLDVPSNRTPKIWSSPSNMQRATILISTGTTECLRRSLEELLVSFHNPHQDIF